MDKANAPNRYETAIIKGVVFTGPPRIVRKLQELANTGLLITQNGTFQLTLGEFLRRLWPPTEEHLQQINKLLYSHRAQLDDLFQHPEDYPAFVVFCALSTLKFTPEQGDAIRKFLTTRVFDKVKVSQSDLVLLRKNLGYIKGGDTTLKEAGAGELVSDLKSDLYEYFVSKVLRDIRVVRTNLLGYLYRAAENRVSNLRDHARKLANPALEKAIVRVKNKSGELAELSDEEALDKLAYPESAQKAEVEREAVEADADLKRDLDAAQLTPRQRELAVLLCEDLLMKEIARRMGVKPPRVSAMLRQLASNPVLRAAAGLSSVPESSAP